MTITINIQQAKTHLSRLLEQVADGADIIITKAGKPMARLVPLETRHFAKKLGTLRGDIAIPEGFNDPLPETVLKSFGGPC